MNCPHCLRIEHHFDAAKVKQEVQQYHEHGSLDTTCTLADALKAEGIQNMTLLDIGGGVGSLQYELLQAGVGQVTSVEASSAYLKAAKEEAERQNVIENIQFIHGDFVRLSASIPKADIVTLDRVICCFDDMPALVNTSAARAVKFYGLVYPSATWWQRLGNLPARLRAWFKPDTFPMFYHDPKLVDATVQAHGLKPCFEQHAAGWQVVLYKRAES